MHEAPDCVDLGFAEEKVPPGTHVCQIYSDDDERNGALAAFLLKGLELKERNACFSRGSTLEGVRSHLSRHGVCLDEAIRGGISPSRKRKRSTFNMAASIRTSCSNPWWIFTPDRSSPDILPPG